MTKTRWEPLASAREERWFLMRLVLVVGCAVAGVFLLASVRGTTPTRFPRAKLPDGTWIVARAVSVGTTHTIEIPYSPEFRLLQASRRYVDRQTTQSLRMMIWLVRENDKGEMLDFDWFNQCELVDLEDFRVSPRNYFKQADEFTNQGIGPAGSGVGWGGFKEATTLGRSARRMNMSLVRFELPVVRPRQGMMKLAIYDGSKQVVAQLEIPYPPLPNRPADDWLPDSLPTTESDGNLDVTLTGIEYHSHRVNGGFTVEPLLTFVHDGQDSGTWASSLELIDPLGNISQPWNCDLSPFEPAWKVRLTLNQVVEGRFLPEETKKLMPVLLAPGKQFKSLSDSHTVNGIPVSIIGIGGPGPIEFSLPSSTSTFQTGLYMPGKNNGGMSSSCSMGRCDVKFMSGHPFVITSADYIGTDHNLQLVFRDQNGEVLIQRNGSGIEGKNFWFFEPKSTSQSIEIEIICQKQRHVEFLIRPPKPSEIATP